VVVLTGANAALASTTATQNVTFSVAKALAISSAGDVSIGTAIDPSSGTPTGTANGTLNVKSNDHAGFQIQASTPSATVSEAGSGCTTPNSANTNIMSVAAGSASGGTGGGGTPASSFALSQTATNLYSSVPTMTGSSITVGTTYTVTPGWTTPANQGSCTYTIPVSVVIVAQ
jgi:hypothetical protein